MELSTTQRKSPRKSEVQTSFYYHQTQAGQLLLRPSASLYLKWKGHKNKCLSGGPEKFPKYMSPAHYKATGNWGVGRLLGLRGRDCLFKGRIIVTIKHLKYWPYFMVSHVLFITNQQCDSQSTTSATLCLVGKRDTREVGVHLSYALEFGAS
jgi:hypothetical protein